MTYVYLLQSEPHPGKRYVGATADFQQRIKDHNSGKSPAPGCHNSSPRVSQFVSGHVGG